MGDVWVLTCTGSDLQVCRYQITLSFRKLEWLSLLNIGLHGTFLFVVLVLECWDYEQLVVKNHWDKVKIKQFDL